MPAKITSAQRAADAYIAKITRKLTPDQIIALHACAKARLPFVAKNPHAMIALRANADRARRRLGT